MLKKSVRFFRLLQVMSGSTEQVSRYFRVLRVCWNKVRHLQGFKVMLIILQGDLRSRSGSTQARMLVSSSTPNNTAAAHAYSKHGTLQRTTRNWSHCTCCSIVSTSRGSCHAVSRDACRLPPCCDTLSSAFLLILTARTHRHQEHTNNNWKEGPHPDQEAPSQIPCHSLFAAVMHPAMWTSLCLQWKDHSRPHARSAIIHVSELCICIHTAMAPRFFPYNCWRAWWSQCCSDDYL